MYILLDGISIHTMTYKMCYGCAVTSIKDQSIQYTSSKQIVKNNSLTLNPSSVMKVEWNLSICNNEGSLNIRNTPH